LTGALAVVIVIAAIIALRVVLSLISTIADRGIDVAGRAIGGAFKPSAPQAVVTPQGVVTLTRPGEEIRSRLASVGALDIRNSCLTTASGVVVELAVALGPPRLTCRWNPTVADKSTRIMAEVLHTVRQVDAGAQVVL
jgi:hypothetical protein